MSRLEATDLEVRFGGSVAVDGLSLAVDAGELVGLIGPNGAGKTTTIDALSGYVDTTGEVTLNGRRIDGMPAQARALCGLTRTFQSLELFEDLTVEENLLLTAGASSKRQVVRELLTGRAAAPSGEIRTLMDSFELTHLADRLPTELSHGHRKLLSVARALAGRPEVVLLDEPASGLDRAEALELGDRLRAVVDQGTALMLIDHDMGLVLRVCDRIYVLQFGRLIAVGTPAEIRANPQVIEAYLGTDDAPEPVAAGGPGAP